MDAGSRYLNFLDPVPDAPEGAPLGSFRPESFPHPQEEDSEEEVEGIQYEEHGFEEVRDEDDDGNEIHPLAIAPNAQDLPPPPRFSPFEHHMPEHQRKVLLPDDFAERYANPAMLHSHDTQQQGQPRICLSWVIFQAVLY